MKSKKTEFISLISGKGGAGKTVIGLSIAKILQEAEFKVLFVDSDFSTHGASYFLEDELQTEDNLQSFYELLNNPATNSNILESSYGFYFLPSVLDPENSKDLSFNGSLEELNDSLESFDFVIFDCQAGYSKVTEHLLQLSNYNLIVMEADAVSSSALRVLFIQLSKHLGKKNTWQLFNKLSEEERKIYSNVVDGTLFMNLPPVPFDWKIRSSFALGQLPSLFEKESAFGLAILRILKIVLKRESEILKKIESKAVGDWYSEIVSNVEKLENERYRIEESNKTEKRNSYRKQMYLLSLIVGFVSVSASLITLYGFSIEYLVMILGAIGAITSFLIPFFTNRKLKSESDLDQLQKSIRNIDQELEAHRTLLNTDTRIQEYLKNRAHNRH